MKKFVDAYNQKVKKEPIAAEEVANRVSGILGSAIEEARAEVEEAKLKVRIAQRDSKVDELDVEEAKLAVSEAKRRANRDKNEKLENLREEFDRYYGLPEVSSIKKAFAIHKQISLVEAQDTSKDAVVVAAERDLAALNATPAVAAAEKSLETKTKYLNDLETFAALALDETPTPTADQDPIV